MLGYAVQGLSMLRASERAVVEASLMGGDVPTLPPCVCMHGGPADIVTRLIGRYAAASAVAADKLHFVFSTDCRPFQVGGCLLYSSS